MRWTTILLFVAAAAARADDSSAHASAILEKGRDGATRVAVNGLGDSVLKACADREPKSLDWAKGAKVRVGGGTESELAERPNILGSWRVDGKQLLFEPRFPFLPGTALYVTIDPPLLADPQAGKSSPFVYELQLPKKDLTPVTKIERIYPTRKELPENQLRFYIHFSEPMMRGEAYEHIKLLDAKGKPIDDVFLELGEELWDPTMTRFTLLFHPGRVKQGLKPREELGPILEAGKSYTLVIDGKWSATCRGDAAAGAKANFCVVILAGGTILLDNEPVDPKVEVEDLAAALAVRVKPLQVRFNEPLDHGLLQRVLWVVNAEGAKIAGKIAVAEEETLWSFTPDAAWRTGRYRLVANTILEDLAANRIGRAFEVDIFHPIPKSVEIKTVEIPFEAK